MSGEQLDNEDESRIHSLPHVRTSRQEILEIWASHNGRAVYWSGAAAEVNVLGHYDSQTLTDAVKRLSQSCEQLTLADWVLECDWPGIEDLRIDSAQLQVGGEDTRATCVELLCAAMKKIDSEIYRDTLVRCIGLDGVTFGLTDLGEKHGLDESDVQRLINLALDQMIIGKPGEVFRAWDHVHGVLKNALKTPLGGLSPTHVLQFVQMAMPHADLTLAVVLVANLCGHEHAIDIVYKKVKELADQQERRVRELQQQSSRIGELIDGVDWPGGRPRSDSTTFEPQRLPGSSGRSFSGRRWSDLLRRYVGYDSWAELDFILFLEESSLVASYCEQPVAIKYTMDGATHEYYPDFIVDLRDGRRFMVEIKGSLVEFAKYDNMIKLQAAREFCHYRGWGLLATDRWHTEKDLITRTVPESAVAAFRVRLNQGLMRLVEFKSFLVEYQISWLDAAAMAYREGWRWRTAPFWLSIAPQDRRS